LKSGGSPADAAGAAAEVVTHQMKARQAEKSSTRIGVDGRVAAAEKVPSRISQLAVPSLEFGLE
jgi:hypothetical protein